MGSAIHLVPRRRLLCPVELVMPHLRLLGTQGVEHVVAAGAGEQGAQQTGLGVVTCGGRRHRQVRGIQNVCGTQRRGPIGVEAGHHRKAFCITNLHPGLAAQQGEKRRKQLAFVSGIARQHRHLGVPARRNRGNRVGGHHDTVRDGARAREPFGQQRGEYRLGIFGSQIVRHLGSSLRGQVGLGARGVRGLAIRDQQVKQQGVALCQVR